MGKYDPLYNYLSKRTDATITLTFAEIESIIGDTLPASAKKHSAWWCSGKSNGHLQADSWIDANYKTVDVENGIKNQRMVFERT